MMIQIEKKDDQHIVTISDRIDAKSAPEIREAVETLISEERPIIIFHLEKVNYVSSAGLAIFLLLAKQADHYNESVVLKGLKKEIKSIFEI